MKPACTRCVRLYGRCGGYDPKHVRKGDGFLSRPTLTETKRSPSFPLSLSLSLIQPSQTPHPDNLHFSYFRVFREETALELTGVYQCSLWDTTIVRECHREAFVLDAVVAIGALSKSAKASWMACVSTGEAAQTWSRLAARHREFALRTYGVALRKMVTGGFGDKAVNSLRRALISCLLVFVFESFSGQADMAFSHARIGDTLTWDFIGETPKAEGLFSPAVELLEDDLYNASFHLSLRMLTFADRGPVQRHWAAKSTFSMTADNMPVTFSSLFEAKQYWQLILRRSCHYASAAFMETQAFRMKTELSYKIPGRTVDISSGSSIYSSPHTVPPGLYAESAQYCEEIDRWSSALQPLFDKARPGQETGHDITPLLLRIYALAIRIIVRGTVFTEECSYDAFLPDFREIVTLARRISRANSPQPTFRLDLGIVTPLFIVLLRCRQRSLRREAIAILESSTTQDGSWDPQATAKVGAWIMEKEEERTPKDGDSTGSIPEWARVRFSQISMSVESRSLVVQCVRRVNDQGLGEGPHLIWEEAMIKDW